jgi:hypothetical protein
LPLVSLTTPPVQYKGDDLDPERGPGLGCFRFQLIVLAIFIVLTPLSVTWNWPDAISAALLFAVVILLLITGQTIIFLLRLVAADRRSRRRPLASATKTVGELEDVSLAPADDEPRAPADDEPRPSADDEPLAAADDVAAATPPATPPSGDPGIDEPPPSDRGPVRQ